MKILAMALVLFFSVVALSQAQTKMEGWLIVSGSMSKFLSGAVGIGGDIKLFDSFEKCETKRKQIPNAGVLSCQHFRGFNIQPKELAVYKSCVQTYTIFAPAGIQPCMNAANTILNENSERVPGSRDEEVNFRALETAKCLHYAAIGEMQMHNNHHAEYLFTISQTILNSIIQNNVSSALTDAAKRELKFVNKQLNAVKTTENV